MKNSQLDRLLRFAQRTGDRLIVTDSEGKDPVVILSLSEYEGLLDGRLKLTGKRQASLGQDESGPLDADEGLDLAGIEAAMTAVTREFEDEPALVPVRPAEVEEEMSGSEPERRPIKAVQQLSKDPGEEQFYLEPI